MEIDMFDIIEGKHKYRSRKRVGGKWVYDYGDGKKKEKRKKDNKQLTVGLSEDTIDDLEYDVGKKLDISSPKIESIRKSGKDRIIKMTSKDGNFTVVMKPNGTVFTPDGKLTDMRNVPFKYKIEGGKKPSSGKKKERSDKKEAGPILRGSTHPEYNYTVKVFDDIQNTSTARMFKKEAEAQRFIKLFNQGKVS